MLTTDNKWPIKIYDLVVTATFYFKIHHCISNDTKKIETKENCLSLRSEPNAAAIG